MRLVKHGWLLNSAQKIELVSPLKVQFTFYQQKNLQFPLPKLVHIPQRVQYIPLWKTIPPVPQIIHLPRAKIQFTPSAIKGSPLKKYNHPHWKIVYPSLPQKIPFNPPPHSKAIHLPLLQKISPPPSHWCWFLPSPNINIQSSFDFPFLFDSSLAWNFTQQWYNCDNKIRVLWWLWIWRRSAWWGKCSWWW